MTAWKNSVLWQWAAFCFFEAVFYVAYRYGMSFSQSSAAPFWFPDSVLLCALLASHPRRWWMFVLGALPVRLFSEVSQGVPPWFLWATFAIDSAKGLLSAVLLRRFLKNPTRLDTVKEYAVFCLCAVLLVPAVGALAGAAARHVMAPDYWMIWEQWFLSNSTTQLVVTPVILYWIFGMPWKRPMPSARRALEATLLTVGLVVTAFMAFQIRVNADSAGFAEPRFYAPVPFLFWAAIRFGMFGACGAVTVITLFAVNSALTQSGPFAGLSSEDTGLALQQFLLLRAAPLYLVAVLVSQREQVQRKLRESEERYREMVENQVEMVCRHLPDMTLTFVNETCCRFLGKTREELLGKPFLALVPAERRFEVQQVVQRVIDHRHPLAHECQMQRADGDLRWIAWQDAGIFDPEGELREIQAVGRDISERRRMADALAESERNIAHASRLALVGELTASIAHEINQPLAAILSNAEAAEMLLEAGALSEVRQILADIRRDDLRASEVIQHVRSIVGRQTPRFVAVEMNEVVTRALRLAEAEARRREVILDCVLGPDLPAVLGEPVQLKQVLLNFIINGMDAMTDLAPDRRRIKVRTTCNGAQSVEVSVADAGHGIPSGQLPRVFESFFTTKENGMGLGLALARSIAEAHRGTVGAENNAEGGATFRLRVPVSGSFTV